MASFDVAGKPLLGVMRGGPVVESILVTGEPRNLSSPLQGVSFASNVCWEIRRL